MPTETVEVTITGTKEQVEKAQGELEKDGLLKATDVLRVRELLCPNHHCFCAVGGASVS